ncbi:hypothetical protein KDK95_00430 [Actinospica sp. MGRD01-02]|uniref:Uncharacterized protein n=1 Tax=Actinospica acidithermotolerans TaxID=2828514 RepID=A0A941IGK7_9ACTN|nr:hypothetical protein [Actinospica acidithermotolerans]MBR7824757.1 hypothetical protein [Actinospica acidithermotolerans]
MTDEARPTSAPKATARPASSRETKRRRRLALVAAVVLVILIGGAAFAIFGRGGTNTPASSAPAYHLPQKVSDLSLIEEPDSYPVWRTYPAVLPKNTATFSTFSGSYSDPGGAGVAVDGIYAVSHGAVGGKLTDDPATLAENTLNTIDLGTASPDEFSVGSSSTADLKCATLVGNAGNVDCVWADNGVEYVFSFNSLPDEEKDADYAKAIALATTH